ncbi:MAG: peptidylprolyl isomerase [Thiobacillus sp.]|nr:peptidylprolyl isomerase [Thiobacillus sp.]
MQTTKILLLACMALGAQQVLAADTPAAPAAATNATAASAPAAKLPIAIVNGVALDPMQADLVRMDLMQRKRPASDENVRNALIDNELMSQEALRLGLDKSPEVKAILALQQKDVLAKAVIDDYVKQHPVADERIKAEYEQIKAKTDDMEYQPAHILVADEKLAKQIIAKLDGKKPAKFEDLAKQYSKDDTGKEGGDLGWLSPSNVVPEFAKAMVALKKGEYTKTPVQTQFGWHIIKIQNVRKFDFPAIDKVKGRIANQLLQQDLRKYLAELRATAKIEIPGQK